MVALTISYCTKPKCHYSVADVDTGGLHCPQEDVWPRTAAARTVNKQCPAGLSGTMTRVSLSLELLCSVLFLLQERISYSAISGIRFAQRMAIGRPCKSNAVSRQINVTLPAILRSSFTNVICVCSENLCRHGVLFHRKICVRTNHNMRLHGTPPRRTHFPEQHPRPASPALTLESFTQHRAV